MVLLALSISVAASAAALAQAPPSVAGGLATAPIGRMRLSFSLVPAPLGSFSTNVLGSDMSFDTAIAFGLRPAFDFSINDYFFVGIAPQLMLNVKSEDEDDAGKALDLMVRVGGHAPVAETVHLFGYLAPGYSIIYPSFGDEDPAGFALGIAAGAIYSFPGSLFLVADIGYQIGFQEVTVLGADFDAKLSYLLIGLGVGAKL
jgi:hypothetical protein